MFRSIKMQRIYKYIMIASLCLLTACGTTSSLNQSWQPGGEKYADAQDFFDSLLAEMNYTPEQRQLIGFGRTLLGRPYYYGGMTIDGFDCSGFTKYVYANALHLDLPRTARQMADIGIPIDSPDNLIAGDLVFFNTLGYDYSHVGIYIGNGRFLHASTVANAIVIGDLKYDYFAKRYEGARRLLSI
jgi:hypothetical protein